MQHAKQYFDGHPQADHFYFTEDGFAFFKEQDATAHAFSTKQHVQKITRAEYEAWETGDTDKMQAAAQAAQIKTEQETAQKIAEQEKLTQSMFPDLQDAIEGITPKGKIRTTKRI
ncbi:MAG TPA: hypothetical protein VN721_16645 [Flavipsychrobacter sp.]|nr:hypothetical protein [Flavipsychrobacter sp.]